ncbi:CinA family protein [Canibacter zhoujuaniae]|uniref:CinA family protein n=1 Tax=Canibacter zhoujuaniae TaxID=2708343 RepID=UPI001FB863A6|nr:CinA family protein [Canibacter zhoujuaniae]
MALSSELTSLAAEVVKRLAEKGERVAVAESLTGGLLAATLVSVPGASKVFVGGAVTYATEVKHALLGVSSDVLGTYGPVCADVAEQMASAVREKLGVTADYGVSTTGVAGPDPDAFSGIEAGVFYIACATGRGVLAERHKVAGDRETVRKSAVTAALHLLLNQIAAA